MKVTKDALYPGRYHLPDGRVFECKPEEIPHFAQRVNRMLASGLHIPVAWEHQPDAKLSTAERAATKAKNTIGHLDGARVHEDGYLELTFDCFDADDARQLPKTRFVSPQIDFDVLDPAGTRWPGASITHLAATPVPVQTKQKPFGKLPAKLSVCLSLAQYQPIRLGETEMDENENKGGDKVSDDGTGRLKKVLDALKALDVVLPDDTTGDNLLDRLESALLTKAATEGMEADTGGDGGDTDSQPDIEAESPGALGGGAVGLSRRKQSTQLSQMSSRLKALEQRTLKVHRTDLKTRIRRLRDTGRIDSDLHADLIRQFETVKLSLTTDGDLASTELSTAVKSYEKLKPGRGFLDVPNEDDFEAVELSESGYHDDESTVEKPSEADKKAIEEMTAMAMGRSRNK